VPQKGGDARLAELLQLIQPVLTDFRRPMATVRQGREWLIHIQHILDADLPQLNAAGHAPPVGKGQRVQQKLKRYLARLQRQRDLPDQLVDFRQHLVDMIARWDDDLFRCYDIVGLSPTNNALESRFGRLRGDQRRITGRQFNTATLLDEGPYLIWECGETETQVLTRLRRVAANRADYQLRYQKLRQERDHRQLAYRLQHQLPQVLRELEAQWPAD
jgi:uncharacterized membrane protein YccC